MTSPSHQRWREDQAYDFGFRSGFEYAQETLKQEHDDNLRDELLRDFNKEREGLHWFYICACTVLGVASFLIGLFAGSMS